jgi:D-alanine-D-alanine ligase
MRIAFTFNVKPKTSGPDSGDRYAEWEDEATIVAVEAALSRAGDVIRVEANDDLPLRLHDLRPDIVFNIAEGIGGPNREAHVPAICEFWSTPYTGSDSMTMSLCLDKGRAKEVLAHHGIATAPFAVVGRPEELDGFAAWPAIVKPVHEGSSMGITRASYCPSADEAKVEIADLVGRYGQPAIVEGYLGGREFTCGVLGNGEQARALPLIEVNFDALPKDALPIYSYEAKWIWDKPEAPLDIFRCPAPISPVLAAQVERTALAAYRVLRCRDWARIDLRCDERGVPHILEVNPLPGIHPDPAMNSCLPKAARVAGLDYPEMILSVLRAGAARHGLVL